MIRTACLRALALVLIAIAGGWGMNAQAEETDPVIKPKLADSPSAPSPTTPVKPQAVPGTPQAVPGTPQAVPQTPGAAPGNTGQNNTGNTGATAQITTPTAGNPIQTPAEQRYNIPRNPLIGAPVSLDLTKPLSLQRAIAIGLTRQNTIAIALTQTDVARASLVEARSRYFPQATPSFQYQSNLSPGRNTIFATQTTNTGTTINTTTGTGTTGITGAAPAAGRAAGAATGTTGTTGTTTSGGTTSGSTGSTGSGLTPGQSSGGTGTTTTGTGTGTTTTTGGGTNTITTFGSTASESRTEVVALSQVIYDSGKREANVGFARRSVFGAEYGLGDVRQSVILNVTESYYNLLRNRELVRVQQENVRLAQTTLEAIQAQVLAGTAAQSDTLQAQSNLANARINLLSAQNDVRNQEAALKNAMGVIASQPLILSDTVVPTPSPTPDPQPLDNYVQTAFVNRLDIKQQQESIYAQGYNVRIAQINNGVQVNATVNEGFQFTPDQGEERSFVVAFTYPLFDAGSTRAAVRATKAQQEAARRTLDALEQNVRLDIEQQYNTRELARLRVAAADLAVQAGQLNYTAALEKQRNGLVNILDVLNAQVQFVTAQVLQVQAIYDFYIADARLQRDTAQNDPGFIPDIPGNKAPKRQFTRK